jgi:hypothetical protein
VTTTCPACGTLLRYSVPPDAPAGLVVRLPRPAAEWWDDVVATCTHVRTFCSADHVREWVERTASPPGATVALDECGLSGPFWKLP